MTLGEFLQMLSDNPIIVLTYFLVLPLMALLLYVLARDEGHISPWKYVYSGIIYLVAVPAIFAVTLFAYQFLFERGNSILDLDVYTQILPVLSLVLTFWLIRLNVKMDAIPGFGKLSGLIIMLFCVLSIMLVLDRLHIISIVWIPFQWVILMLIALLVIIRFAWYRISN